jgi:VWFA-related protein
VIKPDVGVQAGVEQVRVEVRVIDDRDAPVMNLQASDFEVSDDGTPQDITTFAIVAASIQRAAAATATPAVPSIPAPSPENTTPSADVSSRRVVLVLDDLHVAATNTPRVTSAARAFLDRVVPASSSVAVVYTSGGGQEFTTDRQLAIKAIDRFRGQKLRSATVERLNDPLLNQRGALTPNADMHQVDRENRARSSLEALRNIARALSTPDERRPLLLFVSEGPEWEVTGDPRANRSDQWSINRGIRDALEGLNRNNVTVFAFDPRGVSTGSADQIYASSIFESKNIGSAAIQGERVRAYGVLAAIAVNTGGFPMLWRPDMSRDFDRVSLADGSYYVLGFAAPAINRGKYHSITVRVKRNRLQVFARSGYFLPGV